MPAAIDITGHKYGELTAIKSLEVTGSGGYKWLFQCECGNQHVASVGSVKSGRVKSCGCLLRKKVLNITNEKYGRLTAVRLVENGSRKQRTKWLFRCDCGNEVVLALNAVRTGNTQSCGCQRKESSSQTGKNTVRILHKNQVTHGMTGTRIYKMYKNMKSRCYNPRVKCYEYYGGKGITICTDWLSDPQKFINWALSHGYNDQLTIERKDSDKGYSPDNCEFITQAEQARRAVAVREKCKRNNCNVSAS